MNRLKQAPAGMARHSGALRRLRLMSVTEFNFMATCRVAVFDMDLHVTVSFLDRA